jgi:hypothetical protein
MKAVCRWSTLLLMLLLVVACGPTSSTAGGTLPSVTEAIASPTVTSPLPTETPLPPTTTLLPTPLPPTPIPPTPVPTRPTLTPTTPAQWIQLDSPLAGALVSSPVQVRGAVGVTPFESTLVGRVYDAGGVVIGQEPIMLPTEMGQPGTFEGLIHFQAGPGGPGRVEVVEISPKDGAVVVSAAVDVVLEAGPAMGAVEVPLPGARVTLPLHILARVGQPGESLTTVLRWQDGTELDGSFTTLAGEDGGGLLLDSLDWMAEGQPPEPPTQPAALEIRDAAGATLARQEIVVLSPQDPDTQLVTLYFLIGETLQPEVRRIPRTVRIGTAALEELLWGPGPRNLAGFGTALPTPEQVLAYLGREPDWGPRVTLRKLTIVDGLATADFSQEMRAYGGGSLRVLLIRQQIEATLKEFSTVSEVLIAVEGETEGVLEP